MVSKDGGDGWEGGCGGVEVRGGLEVGGGKGGRREREKK